MDILIVNCEVVIITMTRKSIQDCMEIYYWRQRENRKVKEKKEKHTKIGNKREEGC